MKGNRLVAGLLVFFLSAPTLASSQVEDLGLFPPLEWRSIGPDRGGPSIAIAGLPAVVVRDISNTETRGR